MWYRVGRKRVQILQWKGKGGHRQPVFCHNVDQSWARDNIAAITWSCFQATKLFLLQYYCTIFCVPILSRHRDLNIVRIFSGPWGSSVLRCRLVVVTKLENCRVPSSDVKAKRLMKDEVNVKVIQLWWVVEKTPCPQKNIHQGPQLWVIRIVGHS